MVAHIGVLARAAGAALVASLAGACSTSPDCTTHADDVGTCKLEYRSCADWHGNWTARATDVSQPPSGLSAASGQCGTRDEAETQAGFELFQQLDGCNCEEQSIPYGRCTLIARGCFLFESAEAFQDQVPAFRMRITDQATGNFGTSGLYAHPQDGFNPALADLETKMDLDACTL